MTRLQSVGAFAAYVAVYLALDWASYIYPVVPLGITPWNPSTGLSLFLLLTAGQRFWPALFVSAILADVVVRDASISPPIILTAAFITGGYVAASDILRRTWKIGAPLGSSRHLVLFFAVAAAATCAVAVMYVGLYTAIGTVSLDDAPLHVLRYWVGDLNGILVLTPALLCIQQVKDFHVAARRLLRIEIALQLGSIAGALGLIFAFSEDYPYRSFYSLFLPLIWISARWGLPGAALAQLVVQLGLIACVQAADYHAATFVQLQWLMTGLCVVGLTLGAISSHRARLESTLLDRQAAFTRAQQFAVAGEMTSALAHQLIQPMTALNSYIGACQIIVGQPTIDVGQLRSLMDRIEGEVRRSSDVVSRLRDFYRRGAINSRAIEAGRLIENVVKVVQRYAQAAGVEMVTRPGAWTRILLVDSVQIENSLQNILVNAIQAMDHADTTYRQIEISILDRSEHVEIRIVDTGPGILDDMAGDLFEPFHTSKPDGMGMGLAIARSLVRASGGDVWVEPSQGRGASFAMRLPAPGPRIS